MGSCLRGSGSYDIKGWLGTHHRKPVVQTSTLIPQTRGYIVRQTSSKLLAPLPLSLSFLLRKVLQDLIRPATARSKHPVYIHIYEQSVYRETHKYSYTLSRDWGKRC